MSLGRTVKLNNGLVIPQVGYGTWQAAPGEVEKAVEEAIKVGYRHIDCALVYQNQDEVATGIKASGVPREELVLVSKLWNNSHRPEDVEADLDFTLKQLGTSYLDVYLIHWPVAFKPGKDLFPKDSNDVVELDAPAEKGGPSIVDTWKALIKINKETNKTKAIGVSNFTVDQLEKVISATGVVPAMNQIECHPSLIQPELFKYCKEKGIIITAYSPLGNNITGKPRVIDHPEIKKIAERLGKSPAQVLIAWVTKQGFVVIPKSVTPERIKSNFEDFELSDADFEEINKVGLANQVRSNIPYEYGTSWPVDIFSTPEEKGQPKAF
ncbi:oxidoreductase [Kwoniella mangroviensis CBS 10435]|uniref:Oxidoreductase n=1 Tax=Kwoniella mangroviensis CBS 10435 TaxID=1331196 RepID=A0A1B9IKA0_9TREE|nr:oxidoreductase [Kwoniella mangroviensis CBS 8507]OCF55903.1 oxidoreductase [Kwoniella mangroviensis CBS 10435]OCF65678.1 oxidoreductase [Kwoniella mangroviensis CBS 8507]OCF71600.1 oxidoreductase [Kwoniella mangroviensis CBS 8886]